MNGKNRSQNFRERSFIGRILSESNDEPKILAHAVAHVFERKSVVPEHELMAVALARRPGEVDLPRTLKGGDATIAGLGENSNDGFSTRQILATELDFDSDGQLWM
jgi:hypothetical protein